MGDFDRLLSPVRVGGLELRNRIALCPMGTHLGNPDGTVSDDEVAWLAARARGGAGLVLVGSVAVGYPAGSFGARQTAASDDRFVPGLTHLAEEVHAHGAAIAAQLVHDGSQSLFDIEEGRPLLVPSKVRPPAPDTLSAMLSPEELGKTMAPFTSPTASVSHRVAEEEDLAWVVERFAAAARRCVDAGFDAIELHAGHGYLLHAFLSPFTNRRTDRYGGDAAGRATLFLEVVDAVRAEVGPDVAVWARVGASEPHRSPGQEIDDALVAMRLGVDAGLDAVHVTAYGEPMVATGITDGHTPHEPAALLPLARRVRHELGVPVLAMGRLTPERAEQAVADGDADVIAMGRPLIADPDLPAKLAAGRRDRVRPCAYRYRCIGSIFLNEHVRCTVNPEAGFEARLAAVATAAGAPFRALSVVVVGGGPAGLECARRLVERGHAVRLFEAAQLGGRLRDAERAEPDFAGLADWFVGAAADAGVELHEGTALDAAGVAALGGVDRVVVATGAAWSVLPPDLDAELPVGARVAVVGHGSSALSSARHLQRAGRAVTLLTPEAVVAPELGLPGRFRAVADAGREGVELRYGLGSAEAVEEAVTSGAFDHVLRIGPGEPVRWDGSAVGVPVDVIGDASGTVGLEAGLRAAATLALSV